MCYPCKAPTFKYKSKYERLASPLFFMVTKLVVDAGRLWTNLDWSTGQPKFRTDHITKSGAAKAAKMSGTTMDSDAGFRRLFISDQASMHRSSELPTVGTVLQLERAAS